MVRTQVNRHPKIVKAKTKLMIDNIFGKSLTIRVATETLDTYGQLSARSTVDTSFTGDLQFGIDLKKEYITVGIVEVGDAVLYIHPDELSTLPKQGDIIVDDNAEWEVVDRIKNAQLGGTSTHYSYRCKRRIEASDT